MNNRMLNIGYAIETLCARLNGSAKDVEFNKSGFKNVSYTKKIGGRGRVSSQCQKYNMKNFMEEKFGYKQNIKIKDGKQVKLLPDPYRFAADDIFGFMLAEKSVIDKETYDDLTKNQQKIYSTNKQQYVANITKKRLSRLQMNSLINISNRKVEYEWNTCGTTGDAALYQTEVYSGVMSSIANLNISQIGKFNISNIASELRDYTIDEAEELDVKELDKEEKYNRIEAVLRSLEYLSIKGNQTNNLTDTKPKFIIMGEYSWGNNVFQGIVNSEGIDIEMLNEALEQNEKYRISDIWIGVNRFFDDNFNNIKEELEEKFGDCDFIHICNVNEAFDNYLQYLKETI